MSGTDERGAIVALHGVTDNAASLSDLARHWNPQWRVHLVDTLGHGLSRRFTREELDAPFDACARAIAQVVVDAARTAKKRKVVLIGHSLGGAIATRIACDYPDLVECLILEDPALLTGEQADLYRREASALVTRQDLVTSHVGDAIVELMRVYRNWPASEYGAWAQGKTQVDRDFVATGVVGMRGRHLLERIEVPTLLLTGDGEDVLFGPDGLVEVEGLGNPRIQSAVIANASHVVRRDQPEAFYRAVDAFLDECLAGEAPAPRPWIAEELLPVIEATPEQDTDDVAGMREEGERLLSAVRAPSGVSVDIASVGDDGEPVELRILRRGDDDRAAVLSIHGGGYVAGRARYDDQRNAELIDVFNGAVVASPDYRLAPEHPYPAAVDDCHAALVELSRRTRGKPLYVYGDSAGAGLARHVAEWNIRHGSPVPIAGLILLEPCLEPQMSTGSFDTYADGPIWTRAASEGAWRHYIGAAPDRLPYVPSRDVAALMPPTLVVVNPVDPLRDEGIRLAGELVDAGVPTELHMLAGTFHGALSVPGTTTWGRVQRIIREFIAATDTGH
ncbi:alpha/beta fold hydrolase [Actinomyces sp. B33]|uniref:alpha/beta fold hydrolase n=1 Tax=Actinomyces sp. B33 TaxID=2942131 RepID=UPI0023415659|nr:alpha/beta fold hydrolase [Actinomyces sp. B33]MDC4233447.1 alpha/beta fold hydrolase [Actinomyces sp. B33]